MKKFTLAAVAALALSAAPAFAADLPVKALKAVAPQPPAWTSPSVRRSPAIHLARHHAVEPQAVGRGLLRAALQP